MVRTDHLPNWFRFADFAYASVVKLPGAWDKFPIR